MATSDELREEREQAVETEQEKRDRLDRAIQAREKAEQYQGDLESANEEADRAEEEARS